ncbi:MAG: NAD-dependent epimerase/dehydratase family protein [Planctomycetota bacterium]
MKLLCLGHGYCAAALGRALAAEGWSVAGTSRDGRDLELGVEAWRFARGAPLPAGAWAGVSHVLSSIPPDEEGDPVLDELLAALRAAGPRWVGYLSSTGVYGDHGGAWVDASTPLAPPTSERARRRAAAEAAWRALAPALPVHVFRLGGIYGPGRSALERVAAGAARRIDAPEHPFSRVHRDDVVAALRASLARPRPGAVYDLVDDEPSPQAPVIELACELLGAPLPPLEPLDLARLPAPLADFYRDRRRVRNEATKRELGLELRYPTFREGLRALASGKV